MTWFGRIGHWLYQQPYLLLSITFLAWAINIVLGRYVADHIPPIALTMVRWGMAFMIVLPFAWPHLKLDWPAIRANLTLMTVLAIAGTSGYNVLAYWALHDTQAINALLIQSTSPLVVALWAFAMFGDRLSLTQALGILTSFAGVAVILCRGDFEVLRAIAFNRGDVWFCVAMIIFAFYSALVKKRPAIHPMSFLAFTMGWGTLWLTPLYVWEIWSGARMVLDATTVLTLIYVAIFPSIVAYFCFNRGIELVGPNRAAALYPLIVVFGSLFAIGFLGERPQVFYAVGYALVFAGVIIATRRHSVRTPSANLPL